MSSSQPFLSSSPYSPSGHRRKSAFTYKHLSQLGLSLPSCPLRVIAHIDLDAFYAQCEMVRLNVADDRPLAVQQWQGLIAINYPARKFGLNRHITITEAKKLCPHLIMQHVATWKEGDEKWAYHEDAFAHIATHKVSLDPYRRESKRILACIKDVLPATPVQRVEKASIDEVFLDLSTQVYNLLLARYPEISGPAPYDDPLENLPRPFVSALDWRADNLVDLDPSETEDDDPDWDDIAMLIGSEIIRSVRAAIHERLKYTCSAGIARNKMIAKLGSAHKKPNQQTVVRNRAIRVFLGTFKFTKIRNLGGKLGDQVVAAFGTDLVKELLEVSLENLKCKLGDETGSWLYQYIRGDEYSEVNSRTQIKSMLSAKSFRPAINSSEQAVRWLRIFAADINSRLVEEGANESKRRPKSINLHHRQGAQMRSRQAPIPSNRPIDEAMLYDLAVNLLGQVVIDGKAWPCANLQLSVGAFEDGIIGNRGIDGFLLRGEEAKALKPMVREGDQEVPLMENNRPEKRQKTEIGGIQRWFIKKDTRREHDDDDGDRMPFAGAEPLEISKPSPERKPCNADLHGHIVQVALEDALFQPVATRNENDGHHDNPSDVSTSLRRSPAETYLCEGCSKQILLTGRDQHEDWHFAKDLQVQERKFPVSKTQRPTYTEDMRRNKGGRKATKMSKAVGPGTKGVHDPKTEEKVQSRLAFGT